MSDTLFNPFMADTADDTVTTMGAPAPAPAPTGGFDFGGLGQAFTGALSAFPFLDVGEMPEGYDIPDYLARVGAGAGAALASAFPGVQARPQQVPGLTDLTFTRGYYGPEEDVFPSMFGTQSAGTRFWSPGGVMPAVQPPPEQKPREDETDYERGLASALGGLFGSFASAAASPQAERERLARLEAQRDITNITNTFTPSNVVTVSPNISPTFSQSQQQSMGGGTTTTSRQTQDTSRGTTTTNGGLTVFTTATAVTTTTPTTATAVVTTTPTTTTAVGPLTGNDALIEKNYRDILGRSAEPAALEFWGNLLKSGTLTPDRLDDAIIQGAQNADRSAVTGIRASTEAERARFGEFLNERDLNNPNLSAADRGALADFVYEKNPTSENLINNVYQNLFGRPAEQAGLDFWKAQIDSGVAPAEVARRIAAGAQNEDRRALDRVDEASWLAQNVPLPAPPPANTNTLQAALQQAANDFKQQQPGAGDAAGAAVRFADFLGRNNPELVKQLFSPGADGLIKPEVADIIADIGASDVSKLAELSSSLTAESVGGTFRELGGELAGGIPFASTIAAALTAEDFTDFVGKAGTSALLEMGASTIATALGIPVVGPVISAAVALDAVLSNVFGYDSPVQDGIAWIERNIEKGVEWIGDRTKNLFNPGKWSFQAGGLVDIGGDPLYNSESEGVLPDIEMFAQGGVIPLVGGGKIAIGPGGGLDDLIPTSINGRRAAALSDGEFVIPADVVSMMGDGSSNAGARRLYDLVKQIRQEKTGTSKQAGPLPVGKILERTMR